MGVDERRWGRAGLAIIGAALQAGKGPGGGFKKSVVDRIHLDPNLALAVRVHTEKRMAEQVKEAANEYQQAVDAIIGAREAICNLDTVVTEEIRKTLADIRGVKMALRAEAADVLSMMNDLRSFALAEEHTEQIGRLKELCDLCDRLQRLHDSGLLGKVSETIIRLMEANDGPESSQGPGEGRAAEESSEGSPPDGRPRDRG